MRGQVVAQTKHLKLRQFKVSDGKFVKKLMNTPGWLQFIGDRQIRTEIDAQLYILSVIMTSYVRYGYGMYLVETKKPKRPIGMCGLVNREGLDNVDIGFALLPEYAGKGLAFEAAQAVLIYAKKEYDIKTVLSITNDDNVRSIKLLERLGLRFDKKIKLPHEDTELLLFTNSAVT